ncbi:MAG: aldehyde ferredoxin oxidoreductase family protein [Candidatus Micrarchaeaceae archaeon]
MEFRILRVNLTDGSFKNETVKEEIIKKYLGGRGLGAYMALKELPKGIDPLGPGNKLYFFSGPLSGVTSISSSRITVVGKSPLTGSYTHSNAGGNFNYWIRKSGYDGIIFEGASREPVYLAVIDGKPELKSAKKIWGQWTGAATQMILKENNFPEDETKAGVAVIGPAGEHLVKYAGIRMSDYERFAARGGLGAVMGSKNLKGIIVWGKRDVLGTAVDKNSFMRLNGSMVEKIATSDTTKLLHNYGTNALMGVISAMGALPINNFTATGSFDVSKVISDYIQPNYVTSTHGCYECPIACTQIAAVAKGPYKTGGPLKYEYESTWTVGPNIGLNDPEPILKIEKIANELGFDIITYGNTLATAIELAKKGKLKLDMDWGDASAFIDMAYKVAYRIDIGDELAEGDYWLSRKYGEPGAFIGSRGQGLPAYDPRGIKSFALAYYTSNRGGDHLEAYAPTWEVFGVPEKVDPLDDSSATISKRAEIVKWNQDLWCVADSAVMCKFENLLQNTNTEKDFAELLDVAFGWNLSPQDINDIGERIFNTERLYHVKEGKWVKDELAPRMREPIPAGPSKGNTASKTFDEGIKVYYKLRGWSEGKPSKETLERLGLQEFEYLLNS